MPADLGNKYGGVKDVFGADWIQYAEEDLGDAVSSRDELGIMDSAHRKLLKLHQLEIEALEKDGKYTEARAETKAMLKLCLEIGKDRAKLKKSEFERQKIAQQIYTQSEVMRKFAEIMQAFLRSVPDERYRNAFSREMERLALGVGNGGGESPLTIRPIGESEPDPEA